MTKEQAKQKAVDLWCRFPRPPVMRTNEYQRVEAFLFRHGQTDEIHAILTRQARGSVGRCLEAIQAAQMAVFMHSNDIYQIEE